MSLFLGRAGGTLIVRRHRHLDMNDEEDDPENKTYEGDDKIGDGEEIIFPAHPRCVGEDEGFRSVEGDDRVIVLDLHQVLSRRKPILELRFFGVGMAHASVQLAEVGQCRRPHPHDEVFVLIPVVGIWRERETSLTN